MPAATATFRLSTGAAIGMATARSAAGGDLRGKPGALVAEQEGHRAGEVDVVVRLAAAATARSSPRRARPGARARRPRAEPAHVRHPERAAHRAAQRLPRHRVGAIRRSGTRRSRPPPRRCAAGRRRCPGSGCRRPRRSAACRGRCAPRRTPGAARRPATPWLVSASESAASTSAASTPHRGAALAPAARPAPRAGPSGTSGRHRALDDLDARRRAPPRPASRLRARPAPRARCRRGARAAA